MSTNKEYLKGHRIEKMIDIGGDFCFEQEEFNKIIEPFLNIPENHNIPCDALLYVSSAWKEGDK